MVWTDSWKSQVGCLAGDIRSRPALPGEDEMLHDMLILRCKRARASSTTAIDEARPSTERAQETADGAQPFSDYLADEVIRQALLVQREYFGAEWEGERQLSVPANEHW